MNKDIKFASIKELYKMFLEIAGSYQKEYKNSLYSGVVAIVSQAVLLCLFYPLLVFAYQGDKSSLNFVVLAMIAVLIVFMVAKFKSSHYDHAGTFVDVGYDLRLKLGKKLTSVPLENLGRYKTGELNAVFASNVDSAVMLMNMIPLMFLEPLLICSFVIIATLFANLKIALILIVMLPLVIPLYNLKRKMAVEDKKKFMTANASLESSIIEYIQGIGVLRSVNLIGKNSNKLQREIENVRQIQLDEMTGSNLPILLTGSLIIFTTLLAVFVGVYLNISGEISLGLFAAVLVILPRLNEPFSILLVVASVFDVSENGFRRTKEILNMKELEFYPPITIPEKFDIEFNEVDFAYFGSDKNSLNSVSFKIPAKSMTAIVGASGSGKTTAIKMLMRYADAQKGEIKIGGVDIRSIRQEELMKCLSVVFQDVYLFDDTVLNNIRMGRASASDKEVENAAKTALCDDFISRLPKGYETRVGDIGGNLSGGEKQRISIARAILKDSPIVILDEPTAALDTASELAVQKAIDTLVKDKTVIVIAHRLSTIVAADQILVFDDANLVEKGSHEELLSAKGRYYSMWQAQQNVKIWHAKNKDA
ncbi:ABC transporter ATP-binding protein [Campylobacter sp. RM16190]|uniref:ABC transporter ATP-binding protein n=1 Tax=Campylobacter sp. RM16190 TaxID=1705727 RepID=UPI0014732547|nr:ABC transporter ATP-binding protein [Campylobacter sp. RM16190]